MGSDAHSTWRRGRTFRASKPAVVKEASANAEIPNEETITKASPGTPRPRTVENGGLEQSHVQERSADLRPRHYRFRRVVLLRAAPRTQSHRRRAIQNSPRTPSDRD